MRKQYLVSAAVLAALSVSHAMACTCGPGTIQKGNVCIPKPAPPAQSQGQSQTQGQGQTATGGTGGQGGNGYGGSATASSSAETQSSSGVTDNTSSYYNNPRQTPMAMAGFVQPTSSCKNAINGGASSPLAALSFGVGKRDDECDAREAAREMYEIGRADLAVEILCKTRAAQGIPDCKPKDPVVVIAPVSDDELKQQRMQAHGFPSNK